MQVLKHKSITILSDGSLKLSFTSFYIPKQLTINERDNKNFFVNKKQENNQKNQPEAFSFTYKKKYLV